LRRETERNRLVEITGPHGQPIYAAKSMSDGVDLPCGSQWLWSIVFGKKNTMNTNTATTTTTTTTTNTTTSNHSTSSSSNWYRPLTVGELKNVEIRVGGIVKVTFRGMPWQGYPDHWTEPTATTSTTITTTTTREEASSSSQPVAIALHASSFGMVVIARLELTHRQYKRLKEQVDPEDVLDWLLLHCTATSPVHIQGIHFQKDTIHDALDNWNLLREGKEINDCGEEATSTMTTTNHDEQPNNNNNK